MRKWMGFVLTVLVSMLLCASACALSLSGTVYVDKSVDGNSTGEKGLEKVQITLEAENGGKQTAATGKDGTYRFDNVTPGEYRLNVTLPRGYVPSVLGEDNVLLPAAGEECETPWFSMTQDQEKNMGATKTTVAVGLIAFIDENANGGRMKSEPPVRGVRAEVVYTLDESEYPVAEGTTDKEGNVRISSLSPGTYRVKVTLPDNLMIGPKGLKINNFYNCMNPSDGQIAYSDEFTLTKGSLGMGIGVVRTGSAQGSVWFDENHNGRRDANESGYQGVSISLHSEELNLTRETQVHQDGSYSFTMLQPSTYSVTATLPQGMMFAAGDSLFSDGYSLTQSAPVVVLAESTSTIQPIGVTDATGLKVQFYDDMNANGIREENEPAWQDGEISIISSGRIMATTKTNEMGEAIFPAVRAGDVSVNARVSGGRVFSISGADNDFPCDTAMDERTIDLYLNDASITVLNAGVTTPSSVSGQIYADENNDGKQDAGEGGMGGFTVQAVNAAGEIAAQSIADGYGNFTLTQLLPTSYTVRVALENPYIAAPAGQDNALIRQNAEYGETGEMTLFPGEEKTDIKAGVFKAGVIKGSVMLPDGTGLAHVTASLMLENGGLAADYAVSETDETGLYYIKGILPGNYCVQYTLPDDALFMDTDDLEIRSEPVQCVMGTEITLDTLYAVRTATIRGSVLASGKPVSAQIVAQMENGSGMAAYTLEDGSFTISLLRPGTYQVIVTLPEEDVFSFDTALVPAKNSNVSKQEIELSMAQVLDNQMVKATLPGMVTGYAYWDEDNSGDHGLDETLVESFAMTFVSEDGTLSEEVVTDVEGQYATAPLIPGKYRLTVSLSEDCILAGDQAQQDENGLWNMPVTVLAGETTELDVGQMQYGTISGAIWSLDGGDNLSGIQVDLYAAEVPQAPAASAVSDEHGRYTFERLFPDEYYLSVTLPRDYLFARTQDSREHASAILSDTEEGMAGHSEMFYLSMGEARENVDIGVGAQGEIGDFVWLDENGNGMQDIGEPGIPEIRIEMMLHGEVVAETTTDAWGKYHLENLHPGVYTMRVTIPDELKATRYQEEFPLAGGVKLTGDGNVLTAENVVVPSGKRTLSCDVGLALKKEGKYPDSMKNLPATDWSFGGTKNK